MKKPTKRKRKKGVYRYQRRLVDVIFFRSSTMAIVPYSVPHPFDMLVHRRHVPMGTVKYANDIREFLKTVAYQEFYASIYNMCNELAEFGVGTPRSHIAPKKPPHPWPGEFGGNYGKR